MISKIEKNEILKIQIKKYWIPFIFIILCIMNVSIIPNLLKNNQPEMLKKISKTKLSKYHENEINNNDERTNIIFHEKNHHDKKIKKERKKMQKNERAHYIKTAVYIIVLLSLILLSIIFIAKANMQSNIPISSSMDPRIEGYINLPETIETYQLKS